MTLDSLGLKPRTLTVLKNPVLWNDAHRSIPIPREASALAQLSFRDLLKIKRFGWRSLLDVVACLERHGFELRGAREFLDDADVTEATVQPAAALVRTKKQHAKKP